MRATALICRGRRSSCWRARGVLGCLASLVAQVVLAAPFAAPALQPIPSSAGGLARVTVALIIVLAAVLAAAWFTRRVRGLGTANSPSLQVLAQLSLGARERAVLVRVGKSQLLLGVSPGNVRTLYVLDATAAPVVAGTSSELINDSQRPTFKSMLLKSLGQ